MTFRARAEQLDAITKPIRNFAWLGGLLIAAWVQFLGPGLTAALRELSGSNDLHHDMQVGFENINNRLLFIEDNIAPPVVAIWNNNRQIGSCNEDDCRVIHNVSRTSYGEDCGIPIATAEIKLSNGEIFPLPFGNGFQASEATLNGLNIIVPFIIADYIPDGQHEYRFQNIYPSCEWSREPIPRLSPWFEISVSRNN
jgi:hypothetical protein